MRFEVGLRLCIVTPKVEKKYCIGGIYVITTTF